MNDERRLQVLVDEAMVLLDAPEPDCRLADGNMRKRTEIVNGAGRWERVYCANCGADGGMITADWSPHVFFLCDDCVRTHGALPAVEIPEELVRGITKLTAA